MKKQPIGILDTGLGGLSIYQEIVSLLPHESTLYIGDNAYAPYGKRSENEIYDRSIRLVTFLVANGAKVIVVACNTITVSCIDKLRDAYPTVPIIGTVPVIKTAAAQSLNHKIGILSTTRTAESAYQKNLMKQFADKQMVLNIGTDELVPLIEKGEIEGEHIEQILKQVLAPIQKEDVDTLALGCTHYPFVRKEIQKIIGEHVKILDSGAAIARRVKRVLEENKLVSKDEEPTRTFYTTADAAHVSFIAKKLLGATITMINVTI